MATITDEEVVAASRIVRDLALGQADMLKGKLPSNVPRELKVLLSLFNKYPEKKELSVELFNDECNKDVGNIFSKIVSQETEDNVAYLESIIEPDHKYVFEQIKEHINYYYINFLLCYFLFKNSNMNSGLSVTSDEHIDDFIENIKIDDPTIERAVKDMTRSLMKLNAEKYKTPGELTDGEAMKSLEESAKQLSKYIKQTNEESLNNQSIMAFDQAKIDELTNINESVLFELKEAKESLIGMEDLQIQLSDAVSANDNFVKMMEQKGELDSATMQQIISDSNEFEIKLKQLLNIAVEVERGTIDDEVALSILNRQEIPYIEESSDELIRTRNELFRKQEIHLNLIRGHIRTIINVYHEVRRNVEGRVAENVALQEELRRMTDLNFHYDAKDQENIGQIARLQTEIGKCVERIRKISAAKADCENHYRRTLESQLTEKSDLEKRYNALIGISRAMVIKIQMLTESEAELIRFTGEQAENEEQRIHQLRMKEIELETIRGEILSLREEKNGYDEIIRALTAEVADAKAEVAQERSEAERAADEYEEELESKDTQIEQLESNYTLIAEKLEILEETKRRELVEKQAEIDRLVRITKNELEEAHAYTEKVQAIADQAQAKVSNLEENIKESRKRMEQIVQKTDAELEKTTLELLKTRKANQELLDKSKQNEEELRQALNAITKKARITIEELITAAREEMSKLRTDKERANVRALEATVKAEQAAAQATEQAKEASIESKVSESKIKDAEEMARVAEYMNLTYLIKLNKFNQIILDNRAKIEEQFGLKGETQFNGEELTRILQAIYSAEDDKTLLEAKREYTQHTCTILELADQLILSEPRAQANVDAFLETVELAKEKIGELEKLNNVELDGLKEAYRIIEAAYKEDREKRLELEIELFETRKSASTRQIETQAKIDELQEESKMRCDEIYRRSEAKINELLLKQVANKEIIEDQASAIQRASTELREILIRHDAARAKEIAAHAKEIAAHIKEVEERAKSAYASELAEARKELAIAKTEQEKQSSIAKEIAAHAKEIAAHIKVVEGDKTAISSELAEAKQELAIAKEEVLKTEQEKQVALVNLKMANDEVYKISVQTGKEIAIIKQLYEGQLKDAQFELESVKRQLTFEQGKSEREIGYLKENADKFKGQVVALTDKLKTESAISSKLKGELERKNAEHAAAIERLLDETRKLSSSARLASQRNKEAGQNRLMALKDEEIRKLNAQITELTRRISTMAKKRNSDVEQAVLDASASASAVEAATLLEKLIGQLSNAKEFDKIQHRLHVLSNIESRINTFLGSKSSLTKDEINQFFKTLISSRPSS
jgi:hypothetical protein